jgi:hypothetical protein
VNRFGEFNHVERRKAARSLSRKTETASAALSVFSMCVGHHQRRFSASQSEQKPAGVYSRLEKTPAVCHKPGLS